MYAPCWKTYGDRGIRFYSPTQCFADAEKYLPALLQRRSKAASDLAAALRYLRSLIVPLDEEDLASYRDEAQRRLCGRDDDDWPILAAALSLGCGIWTEDRDLFGTGMAVCTTNRVEIYLDAETSRQRS